MRTCKIRRAVFSDSVAVAEVLEAAFAPLRTVYTPKCECVDRQQLPSGSIRIVAEVSSQIVGTVEVDRHQHKLRLIGLAVRPDFQRLGIGRAMLDWVERHLTSRIIELATIRETGNVMVFEKMGFAVIAEQVADWCLSGRFESLHEVMMAKAVA